MYVDKMLLFVVCFFVWMVAFVLFLFVCCCCLLLLFVCLFVFVLFVFCLFFVVFLGRTQNTISYLLK